MPRVFCKPAKRGSKAYELCPNSPCICAYLYENSDKALMDAAPEMLSTLESLLGYFENANEWLDCDPVDVIKRVIRKAKGEID